jgi:hypothetical protein
VTVSNLVRGEKGQAPTAGKRSESEQEAHIIPGWLIEKPNSQPGDVQDGAFSFVAPQNVVALFYRPVDRFAWFPSGALP